MPAKHQFEAVGNGTIMFMFYSSNFVADIIATMGERGLTKYAAAKQIGIPHTTFKRVLNINKNHHLSTYILICNWLGNSVHSYFQLLRAI